MRSLYCCWGLTLIRDGVTPRGRRRALLLCSSICVLAVFTQAALATMQRNVSADGHQIAEGCGRGATEAESYSRGTVPLPLTPDWVGSRTRAVGALVWFDGDADGDQDLFVGTYWGTMYPPLEDYFNFMYLNDGGMLEDHPSWISADERHTGDAAWGYINDDDYPDIFLANGGFSFQACQVFYGQDGLLPTTAGWQGNSGNWTTGCSLADFDLDNDTDVATTNQGVSPNPYRPVLLFRNHGDGLETAPFWQSNQVGITGECDWGDMNGDTYPDLAVSGWVNWHTGVFLNLGTTLDPDFAWTTGSPDRTDKGVGWADVDGDDDMDLAVGGNSDPDWLFENEGTMLGDTPVWASEETYTGCQEVAWVDIDNDNDDDLALIHFSTGHVRIYLNEGGTFPPIADWQYDAASSGSAIGFGDVNDDGWMDLAIGVANGPIELFINERLPASADEEGAAFHDHPDRRLQVGPNPLRGNWSLVVQSSVPTVLVQAELTDLSGRRVGLFTSRNDDLEMAHAVRWTTGNGSITRELPAGVYLVRALAVDAHNRPWTAESRVTWLGR